jgi:hypothetical protein
MEKYKVASPSRTEYQIETAEQNASVCIVLLHVKRSTPCSGRSLCVVAVTNITRGVLDPFALSLLSSNTLSRYTVSLY